MRTWPGGRRAESASLLATPHHMFALSTHWNAKRHLRGEAMIQEILDLGFQSVELGYDLRLDLVPGVQQMIRAGAVCAPSVHNFCPIPMGVTTGSPEVFTFAHPDPRVRSGAVEHTRRTVQFAASVGAKVVVVHGGYMDAPRISDTLFSLLADPQSPRGEFDRQRSRLQDAREKHAPRQVEHLVRGLEELLPTLQETGVALALENLPAWEAVPNELEMEKLFLRFNSPFLGYWHDTGHGQIRENLGFINQERWLQRLKPWLKGMHVHGVRFPATDHVMPPAGDMQFDFLRPYVSAHLPLVLEPTPRATPDEIRGALAFFRQIWELA